MYYNTYIYIYIGGIHLKKILQKLFTLGIIFTLIIGMVGCSKPQKKKEVVLTNTQEQEKLFTI